ncbi:aminopeptidase N [Nocardioides lianchengensis]|uniref:Aminopeptidase N n=1 Tax=Nocardioides lianchengensis TaxID=1045774 RepID=A0A1G7BCW2_9ACTN|nr:aminopeptidase N [Nocardioides lianchengensis]NYG10044.1 aminopeptidase N [Nocardioides lianchengensis]SDE24186.1 aminopeptidase N [Nocardioides lianchengensis]
MTSTARSLQHTEARARAALLEVQGYDVRLDLASDEATFGSVTTIAFTSRGGPTFLDLKPVRVNALRLNGTPLDPDLLERGRLPLETLEGANELVVDAVMPFRNDGEGLHRSVDPADGRHYVYGMSFMDAAPTIFACFDQPDLKAPYTFHVRAPLDWTVIGNGAATQVEPGLWELATTQPLSTYFVTLVAGPYHVIHAEHDGIPLGLSARQSLAAGLEADAEELVTLTGQCFDELHRLFGIRYPFGAYHQAFVPEFNAGAMENPGCVTFRDSMVFDSRVTRGTRLNRASTIAHEMAHQWFGNIVTPRWWDDLWLNESFAEYLGNRVAADATEYAEAWVDNAYARRLWGLTADLGPGTHPVAGNGAVDAVAALQDFDGISYAKGSTILRQLATSLGDPVFLGGVVDHLERHRFGNATMADLLGSWERVGAGDLSAVTSEWLRTAGADTIVLDRTAGVLRRTPPAGSPADRAHTFRVAVHDAADDAWRLEPVTVAGPETSYDAGGTPVLVDPYGETWAVVPPDPATLRALVDLLPRVSDPLLRSGVWNGVREGLHVGVLDPADVLDLVVAHLPVEDTEDTPQRANPRRTLPWVFQVLLPLCPPGSVARVHAAALDRLTAAESGSELQLAAFRTAIRSAGDEATLRGWLGSAPDGIDPDLELRWRALHRLAVLGATDPAELDAELDAGPTSQTRVEHTRAMSSLPTAAAKEFAWARFSGEVDATNYEIEAAGLGMWQPGQESLTTPYVERFFAALPGLAAVHSGWVLGEATEAFFPATALDRATVDRVAAVASSTGLDPTVRRRVLDAGDRLARMVAVRAAYPS